MSLKPICVPCQRFFRPSQNGRYFTESMPQNVPRPLPGAAEPENWKPYKVWSGDQWACPDCGATVIVGVGFGPVTEHYKDNFTELRAQLGADTLNINDC